MRLALCWAAAMVCGAAAIQPQPAQPAVQGTVSGRDIYRVRCAFCHGPGGRGDGAAGASLNPRPTNFADTASRKATTDSALADVIGHGRRAMPAFARMLSRAQIDSVAAYVKTLSH